MTTGFLRRSLLAVLAVGAFQVSSLTQTVPDWVQPPSRNFPVVGGNIGNQRHSTLRQIDRSTASRVGGAWMVHLEDGSPIGNMQATPVIVDGVMYITTGPNNVFALDARTSAMESSTSPCSPGAIRFSCQVGAPPTTQPGVAR